jgi:hypothetical protein
MERVRGHMKSFVGRRDAMVTAPEVAVVVGLVGLLAFFLVFAPAS